MNYKETLNFIKEHNISAVVVEVANACNAFFHFQYTDEEFEQLCDFAHSVYCDTENISLCDIAETINCLIIEGEMTIADVLEMGINDFVDDIIY